MIITRIHARNFAAWDDVTVQLPETGVVLVTGHNGAGKSTIIEAIAHAVFGKSVRGDWCWRDPPEVVKRGWASAVEIETDRVCIARERRSSGSPVLTKFDINVDGAWVAQRYDTPTKAGPAIAAEVGEFSAWERCHVCSSHDAAHFTLAGDKDRKLLLESLLGLGHFDAARKRAGERASEVEARVAGLLAEVHSRAQAIALHEQTVAQATAALAVPPPQLTELIEPVAPVLPPQPVLPVEPAPPAPPAPVPPLDDFDNPPEPAEVAAHRAQVDRLTPMVSAAQRELGEIRAARSKATANIATLQNKLAQIADALRGWDEGTCPTCTQGVSEDLRGSLVGTSMQRREELHAELVEIEQRAEQLAAQEVELVSEVDVLGHRRDAARDAVRAYVHAVQARTNQRAVLERQHADAVAAREHQHQQAVQHAMAAWQAECRQLTAAWQAECGQLAALHEQAVRAYAAQQQTQREALRSDAAQRSRWQQALTHATNELTRLRAEHATLQDQLDQAQYEQRVVLMAKEVLAPKGVRAHILGAAMSGLEQITNSWLARIGRPGQRVQLAESSSALSLRLSSERRWAWHNYKAASGGERRRVDVAIILALAELSRAAHGRARGTLFFDEVFDALDETARTQVSEVIAELSEDRCVVVITHNPDLAKAITPVLSLHFTEGVVDVR